MRRPPLVAASARRRSRPRTADARTGSTRLRRAITPAASARASRAAISPGDRPTAAASPSIAGIRHQRGEEQQLPRRARAAASVAPRRARARRRAPGAPRPQPAGPSAAATPPARARRADCRPSRGGSEQLRARRRSRPAAALSSWCSAPTLSGPTRTTLAATLRRARGRGSSGTGRPGRSESRKPTRWPSSRRAANSSTRAVGASSHCTSSIATTTGARLGQQGEQRDDRRRDRSRAGDASPLRPARSIATSSASRCGAGSTARSSGSASASRSARHE